MERDQRVCLRCGEPAGDHRFCKSCRSHLDSLLELSHRGGSKAKETKYPTAQPPQEVGPEQTMAAASDGGSDGIAAEASAAAVQVDPDRLPADSGTADASPGPLDLERLNEGARPRREVARFEEVLTPAATDFDDVLAVYRQADAAGDPQGSTNLGVMLEQQGDLEGALAAYERADERGDVNGSFNLGCLLTELGDLPGALAALRRADERGDAGGASNLGVLLGEQGDLDGALAAYQRADERGDATGALNLGLLLAGRGDLAGARAAYRRAAQRGDRDVRERAARAEADATLADVTASPTPETEPVPINEAHTSEPTHVPAQALPEPFWFEQRSAFGPTGHGEGPTGHAAAPEVDSGRNVADPPTSNMAPDPCEADDQPLAQTNGTELAVRLWIVQASRSHWVAALCVLTLLGLVAVLAGRGLRRSS
jgi:tetratricopeptide (TPR) repeat protein